MQNIFIIGENRKNKIFYMLSTSKDWEAIELLCISPSSTGINSFPILQQQDGCRENSFPCLLFVILFKRRPIELISVPFHVKGGYEQSSERGT